jgi:hypothetical protein
MEDELRRNFEDANYRGFSHADKHGGMKITGGPTSELPGRASGSASPWPDVQDSPAGDVVRSVGRAIGSSVASAANAIGVVGTEPAPKPVGAAGGELQLQRKAGGQVDWERSRPSMSPKAAAGQPTQPGAPAPQAGRADLPPIQQTPAGTLERNVGDRTDAVVRASDVGIQRPPAAPLPREAGSSKIERSTVITKGAPAPAPPTHGGVIDSIVQAAESVKEAVVDTVHKVEDKLAGAANKVEDTVASGAHKVEDSLSRNIGQFVQGAEETTRRAADTTAELAGRGVRRAEETGYRVEESARRGKERFEADLGRGKDRLEADLGRAKDRFEGGLSRAEADLSRGVGRLEEGAERLGERFRGERGGYSRDEELQRGGYAATGPLTRSHVSEEREAVLGQTVPQQSQGFGAGSSQLREQEEFLAQRGGGARSPREDALLMRSQIDNSLGKLSGGGTSYGERLKAEGKGFKDELRAGGRSFKDEFKAEGRVLKDEGRALKEEGKEALNRLEAGVKGEADRLKEEGRSFIRGAEDKLEGGAARLRGDWERATGGGRAVDATRGGYQSAAEDYSRQSAAANVTPDRTADRFGREGAAAAGAGRYGYGAAAPGDYSGYSDAYAGGARRDDYGRGSSPDATNQSFTQRGTAAGSTTYGNAGSGFAPAREGGLLGPRKRAGEPGSVEGVGGERRDMLSPPPGVAVGGYNAAGDYTYTYRTQADQAAPATQYRSEGAAAGGWGKPKAHGYMSDHAAEAHAPGAASRGSGFVDRDRSAAGFGDLQQFGRDRFEGGFPLQGRDSPYGGSNADAQAGRERFEGGFPLEGSKAPMRSGKEHGREREFRASAPSSSGRPGGAGFDGLIDAPYRGLGGDYGSVYGYPDPATAALYQKERDQAREASHMAGAAAISGAAQERGVAGWGSNAWGRADRSEHAPGSEGVAAEGFGIKREELGKAPLQGPPKLSRPAAGFGVSGSSPVADRSSVLR